MAWTRSPPSVRRLLDLLERLAAAEAPLDLPDEHEHRARVLAGRVDADGEVRGADGARREADRRAAGQLAVGLGHERRRPLVAGADDPDAGGVEALEQAEEALARHGERVADADGTEGVGDEPADGSGGLGLGVGLGGRLGRLGRRLGFGLGAAASGSAARPAGSAPGSAVGLGFRLSGGLRDRFGFEFGARVRAPARLRGAATSGARPGTQPSAGSASAAASTAISLERHRPSGRPASSVESTSSCSIVIGQYTTGEATVASNSPRITTIATTIIATCANRDPGITAPTGSSRTGAARPRRARGAAR